MKRERVVRVVVFEDERAPSTLPLWLEQFRYAGLLTYHERGVKIEGARLRYVFDLHCPRGVNRDVWTQQNVDRMRSFSINAAAAWSTDDVDPGRILHEARTGRDGR